VYAFWAFFLLGLGVWHKANFGWFLIALPFALFGAFGTAPLRLVNRRAIAAAVVGLVAGALPFITYNLLSGENSFTQFDQLVQRNSLSTLVESKMSTLVPQSLSGDFFYFLFSGGQHLEAHAITYGLAIVAFVLAAVMFGLDRRLSAGLRFLAITILIILALIVWTPRATAPWHVVFLYPFLPAFIAAAFIGFGNRLREWAAAPPWIPRFAPLVMAAVLVVGAFANVRTDVAYYRYFAAEGGSGAWSDAIYSLADYLQSDPSKSVALMDWGFKSPLTALTRDRVESFEVFWALLGPDQQKSVDALDPYLAKYPLFLFHSPKRTQFPQPRAVLELAARRHGAHLVTVRQFYQKNGELIYELLAVQPQPHARAPNAVPAGGRRQGVIAKLQRGTQRVPPHAKS
jgi:hypothetical protein